LKNGHAILSNTMLLLWLLLSISNDSALKPLYKIGYADKKEEGWQAWGNGR
jgi:hypothetical protein